MLIKKKRVEETEQLYSRIKGTREDNVRANLDLVPEKWGPCAEHSFMDTDAVSVLHFHGEIEWRHLILSSLNIGEKEHFIRTCTIAIQYSL